MAMTIHLDIVSLQKYIFSGLVESVTVNGAEGELGILPGHTQLLTNLVPGPVKIVKQNGEEELYYISGGFIEIQPTVITVLADTVERASDLDEAAALEAKKRAQSELSAKQSEMEYAEALSELAQAAAQIRAIQRLRKKAKGGR